MACLRVGVCGVVGLFVHPFHNQRCPNVYSTLEGDTKIVGAKNTMTKRLQFRPELYRSVRLLLVSETGHLFWTRHGLRLVYSTICRVVGRSVKEVS